MHDGVKVIRQVVGLLMTCFKLGVFPCKKIRELQFTFERQEGLPAAK